MLYPVVVYGHPALRKKAATVQPDLPGLQEFIENMWETMYKSDGVGLAAPQVGVSLRIFVIDGSEFSDDDPSLKEFRQTFINPVILERAGNPVLFNEGCLSIPKLREDVERESSIKITFFDEHFEFHEKTYDGIAARIIQHEYDHLDGILFTDRLTPLKKRLIKGKLLAIMKGKYDVHYQTILPKQPVPNLFPTGIRKKIVAPAG
ncbi:MAG TPA: peptide deformylase [Bacteroidetes bacterium]|nr:peptide deformylase [Bacteroidota bacterium]